MTLPERKRHYPSAIRKGQAAPLTISRAKFDLKSSVRTTKQNPCNDKYNDRRYRYRGSSCGSCSMLPCTSVVYDSDDDTNQPIRHDVTPSQHRPLKEERRNDSSALSVEPRASPAHTEESNDSVEAGCVSLSQSNSHSPKSVACVPEICTDDSREVYLFPHRIIDERDGMPMHTRGAFDEPYTIGPGWFDPFARHGRKFKQVPRVKFAENIVTEIRSIPRIDRSLKEKLFYSTEEYMNFREELIYHSEATWENLVVDFLNDQWDKFMFACGFKKLEIRHYHEADLPLDV